MQSLPTALTTKQLDAILATLEKLPSATINRTEYSVAVNARQKNNGTIVRVLDAITLNGENWDVYAVEGLISISTN
jgi:hypothetical protein